jgi:hypothetical protein
MRVEEMADLICGRVCEAGESDPPTVVAAELPVGQRGMEREVAEELVRRGYDAYVRPVPLYVVVVEPVREE